ncbi:hypothetical protein CALVIDRAFT_319033 [Calocera viscosa TUFC12733]|uniref:Uncharacterized protein n=1 Tax=Calocera viscosa (strain TUFC12733) TaxID=1330018 RepID=A0A167HYW8_CALVF|nr:hypothetical protein CALVIDRAFT_319033 [Calocera viscosa TUFC12733]
MGYPGTPCVSAVCQKLPGSRNHHGPMITHMMSLHPESGSFAPIERTSAPHLRRPGFHLPDCMHPPSRLLLSWRVAPSTHDSLPTPDNLQGATSGLSDQSGPHHPVRHFTLRWPRCQLDTPAHSLSVTSAPLLRDLQAPVLPSDARAIWV